MSEISRSVLFPKEAACCILALILAGCAGHEPAAPAILDDTGIYHLRVGTGPEWAEFEGLIPRGSRLDLKFAAIPNAAEATLFIHQEGVRNEWPVRLNGRPLGFLAKQDSPLTLALPIPAGALVADENVLSILPAMEPEDIRVGPVRLDPRPLDQALGDATLDVRVFDALTEAGLPCRLTLVDDRNSLAPLLPDPGQKLAVRPGVIYTGDGHARFSLAAGKYMLHATRGFEYSIDSKKLALKAGERRAIVMKLRREVSTPNLVACDTHVHTRELSGHGDSTLDERMLTLAGEGIELPVATEHNQHADYATAATRTGMARHFTPVAGNEVTTDWGHFNVFPVDRGAAVPDAKQEDWTALMKSVRAVPGVRVAILNHPRGLHSRFIPFDAVNFNPVTGENRRGGEFTFDALELVNSGAHRSDPMQTYRDWFALLNHGYRIVGVGSSDSHDVNTSIVGQGRTYLAVPDADPAAIDVAAACESLVKGRSMVSCGLLPTVKVNDRAGPGDLASVAGGDLDVAISIFGPSWAQPDHVELFLNSVRVREEQIPVASGGGEKVKLSWKILRPPNDAHLVVVVSGPGVREPWWPIARPYQPSSKTWTPRMIGSTNPVWIDVDGDGVYTPPRELARKLLEGIANTALAIEALAPHDDAVAAQGASLLHAAGRDLATTTTAAALERAPAPVRRGFAAFLATLGPR